MKIFKTCYDKVLSYAEHRNAVKILSLISFAESSFFIVPPDILLAPMCLKKPKKSWQYAFYTTCFSVLGGVVGYVLGYFLIAALKPVLIDLGYIETYNQALKYFEIYGILILFVASFSPIPYKIFTFASGTLGVHFLLFIVVSFIGRGLRFFLLAGLIKFYGKQIEDKILRYIEIIGWFCVFLVAVYFATRFF